MMYLPLNKIEEHLAECRERYVTCPRADCRSTVKQSMMNKHNESMHPQSKLEQCGECEANYVDKERLSHSCINYVLALMK